MALASIRQHAPDHAQTSRPYRFFGRVAAGTLATVRRDQRPAACWVRGARTARGALTQQEPDTSVHYWYGNGVAGINKAGEGVAPKCVFPSSASPPALAQCTATAEMIHVTQNFQLLTTTSW
jgi:hypothetical protein